MKTRRIQEETEKMIGLGLAHRSDVRGCTHLEIQEIEKRFSVTLPASYKDFLSSVGRSAGTFMKGSDFLYPEMLDQREFAENMLEEMDTDFSLSRQDYVFLGHQGYSFLFFRCGLDDDPPVLLASDDGTIAKEVARTFTDWLSGCIDDEAAAEAALQRTRRNRP